MVTHGPSLSLGRMEAPDKNHLTTLRSFLQDVGTPWHRDHLCFSAAAGVVTHDLLPVPFSSASAGRMAVENISAYAIAPGSTMSESAFVTEVFERADCSLLLDVNNVFVNSRNHHFDPRAALAQMPLDRVVQLHMAGHVVTDEGLIDTHAEDICDDVFALLAWVLARTGPVPVLLERDDNFPSWEHLCAEIRRLDGICQAAAGS